MWPHFSGLDYYEPRPPWDATQIGRFRSNIGEAGMQAILKATIDTALDVNAIKPAEFERILVDTTVQEKAIRYPVDARGSWRSRATRLSATANAAAQSWGTTPTPSSSSGSHAWSKASAPSWED